MAQSWAPSPTVVARVAGRYLAPVAADGWPADAIPSQADVQAVIDLTADGIAASVTGGLTPEQEPAARMAVAYLAGAEVVLGYFPEAETDYIRLLRSWADDLLAKFGIVTDTGGGGNGGGVVDAIPATPVGYYPQPPCPLDPIW